MNSYINSVKDYLLTLQNHICQALESEEGGKKFQEDVWQHETGGGGCTRVLADGQVIEKAAVNFSHVSGTNLPPSVLQQRPELAASHFQATGVSVIVHPRNPYAPTSHFNIRFFIAEKKDAEPVWWFGGGFDLTPYYGFVEDCIHWHATAKKACDPFGADIYPQFKKACDDYFFIKHRNEPRGIGGLFFDYVNRLPRGLPQEQSDGESKLFNQDDFTQAFAMARSIGDHYIPAYQPILQQRKNTVYGARERDFQCYRRGRYVEFNLIYDRGTLFGLQSRGRVESILASLPPEVIWRYNWQPTVDAKENMLYTKFLVPQDWLCSKTKTKL